MAVFGNFAFSFGRVVSLKVEQTAIFEKATTKPTPFHRIEIKTFLRESVCLPLSEGLNRV